MLAISCLNEETIVAFIDARLAPTGIAHVEEHMSSCASCRELLSLAIAAVPPPANKPPESTAADWFAPAPLGGANLARGTSFSRYTVLGPLGRGAMGEVYAAYDPELDRKVALKILHARGDASDGRGRGRLLREAKAIAKLRHPNVVVVHDAGTVGDRVFLAMEYVDGQTVGTWLASKPRGRQEILDVFIAAGLGLGAAHAAGLAHRDFKPQNVMVGTDGVVRVMDFGLAREIDASESAPADAEVPPAAARELPERAAGAELPLTRTGELVGTPLYMAPEQFKTQRADARSDQFSFCVALYQALYDAHPFGGGKLAELIAAVTAGRVLPAPPKSTVSPWLRRVLLRGLSVDPAARWESMPALTAALARDPVRQRWRWLGAAAVAAALVAAFALARAPRAREPLCQGGPVRLAGVWELAAGTKLDATRRAATRTAFVNTGLANAADAWERAARVLDRYATGWLQMYADTCTATHVRGEQSAEVLDLRMACLDERLGRVKALTDVFLEPNGAVVENAVSAAGALPALDRCADIKLLRAVMPPPDDPKTRARAESLRRDLARVKALGDSGQCIAATAATRKLIADADALGYPPLLAESLTISSRFYTCTEHDEAIRNCRRAVLIGLETHHDEVVVEATMFLSSFEVDGTGAIADARSWIDVAGAVMRGMNRPHPVLESWRLITLAVVFSREGDTEHALDTSKQALALIEKTQGPDHPDYAIALGQVGNVLSDGKRYGEALAYFQRAAGIAAKVNGPLHPTVGASTVNAAEALNVLHRFGEADVAAEEALRIFRHAGAPHTFQAFALTEQGEALLGQGRSQEAIARLEEALRLIAPGESVYLQPARFALARALWNAPAQRPRALALAHEAMLGYQRLPYKRQEATEVDAWLRARGATERRRRD